MEWRFKVDLYPEQLELIIDALDFCQDVCPYKVGVKYKLLREFLQPIMDEQNKFLKPSPGDNQE